MDRNTHPRRKTPLLRSTAVAAVLLTTGLATEVPALATSATAGTAASSQAARTNENVAKKKGLSRKERNKQIGRAMVAKRGWSTAQFKCVDQLWTRESGWNHLARSRSGAYGIAQAKPGSKMRSAGADWRTNPETQVKWGLGYIKGRYGNPCGAWAHFRRTHWY